MLVVAVEKRPSGLSLGWGLSRGFVGASDGVRVQVRVDGLW